MVGLIGVITVIIAFMDSFVAKHTNLMVMLAGSFADPASAVQRVDGGCQIRFYNSSLVTQAEDDALQGLA